jgi:NADH dehydrogenase [ubiquinone] 1 alpha subcomplex assembly factor 7
MPGRPADTPESDVALLAELTQRIRREGPLTVEAYMEACLGHPQFGYYRKAAAIGAAGDFITAPEISQVFGELIGLWCAVTWEAMRRPAPFRLIELGPGRGTLMRDALRAGRALPGFLAAAAVHLVEVSPRLRRLQREALGASTGKPLADGGIGASQGGLEIAWHEKVEDVPPGPAIVVANELLDALPIRQLIHATGGWRERVVALGSDGQLQLEAGPDAPLTRDEARWLAALPASDGAIAELRPGEEALLTALAARSGPLAALLIDYGPAAPALGDTLQAVRNHAYADPLAEPGAADLTAHVQFAAVMAKARAAGLAADGPLTQAELLGRLGIVERTARLMAANPARAASIETGTQRLMSPGGMGQLFKAIAIRSPGLPVPPAFG